MGILPTRQAPVRAPVTGNGRFPSPESCFHSLRFLFCKCGERAWRCACCPSYSGLSYSCASVLIWVGFLLFRTRFNFSTEISRSFHSKVDFIPDLDQNICDASRPFQIMFLYWFALEWVIGIWVPMFVRWDLKKIRFGAICFCQQATWLRRSSRNRIGARSLVFHELTGHIQFLFCLRNHVLFVLVLNNRVSRDFETIVAKSQTRPVWSNADPPANVSARQNDLWYFILLVYAGALLF